MRFNWPPRGFYNSFQNAIIVFLQVSSARSRTRTSSCSTSFFVDISGVRNGQKIKEKRKEEKFSFKGEVHQSNGTVWPAWWDVRRHFKANILKRWQYNSPTEMNFVWLILRNFSSRSIDMRTKSKQLLAKNLQQTQVPQMSPSIRLVGKPLYWG